MAYELNKKLKGIEPYSPINENYAVRLDANESCFNIGDKLGDVIADAVRNIDFNRYPDSAAELVTKGFADFTAFLPKMHRRKRFGRADKRYSWSVLGKG